MKLRISTVSMLGKGVRKATRLIGKNGAALPGLIIEKLMPSYLARTLHSLPQGIVVITGTNGKTTTTKIVVDLLRQNGLRVLTNKTGSNFTRGVVSSIVEAIKPNGVLPYDIAIFELDEAYAKKFTEQIAPAYVVALNVMRDQLDRFGEIDTTAQLIGASMARATKGIIVNAHDERLATIADSLTVPRYFFSISTHLAKDFPTDEEIAAVGPVQRFVHKGAATVEFTDFTNQQVTYTIHGKRCETKLQLVGQYNFQNAAAALTLLLQLLPEISAKTLLAQLSKVTPAFGRGEVITYKGQTVELLLIKNPAGFRQALLSFTKPAPTMIAINDADPDGRDISWLWDVDFASLKKSGVAVTSGRRASDMALRLQYDNVTTNSVERDLKKALTTLLHAAPAQPKRIYANYTAMLALRALLGRPEHGDYNA